MNDEQLIKEVNKRAAIFVADNFTAPTPRDLMVVKNAMLIGASIAIEIETESLLKES